MSSDLTQSDREVMDLIRVRGPLSVVDLESLLGVTATAVRHRLSRLSAGGLVDRVESRQPRGRPSHKYVLTQTGTETTGYNFEDFAKALWGEVQQISDDTIRRSVVNGVIDRLAEMYSSRISGDTTAERLESLAEFFRERQIPFHVEMQDRLPVLRIVGCPYPELSKTGHEICEMEQELFSRLATVSLTVDHCDCDSGGQCCSFQPESAKQQLN